VVLVAVVVWWLFSGNGPNAPQGNGVRLAVPTASATPVASGVPVEPTPVNERAVRIDSFVLEPGADGDRLALNYMIGVPECYGTLERPVVIESDVSVVVTLTRELPASPAEACIEVALQQTVRVALAGPLGDRSVLDGSVTRRVRVPAAERPYE
jgi:hypothetical protein